MSENRNSVNRKLIMLVDDNPANLMVGKENLANDYRVLTMPSAAKMFEMLKKHTPELILLDVDMPEIDGYDAIRRLKADPCSADIPVIFLTAMSEAVHELQGWSLGAIDYISKPFSAPLLRKRIEVHLLVESQRKDLKEYNDNLQEMVAAGTRTVLKLQNKVLRAMAELVEGRDTATGNHIERTQHCLGVLLTAMIESNVYPEEVKKWNVELLLQSSQLHDVGKIAIQDNILKKPGKLTKEEFDEMKKHVIYGVEFIEKLEEDEDDSLFLRYAKIFVAFHHEKWDGSGYPYSLSGQNIPLLGRLMAVVDVYEALTSSRPYKDPFDHETAINIIREGRGTHFDPQLVDVFERCEDKLSELPSDNKAASKEESKDRF